MFDNPKWFITFFLIGVGLTVFCAFGDGIVAGPSASVWGQLLHGDVYAKIDGLQKLFFTTYDWLNPWLAWFVRLIDVIVAVLSGWQIMSMARGR